MYNMNAGFVVERHVGKIKITTRIKAVIKSEAFLSFFISVVHEVRDCNRDIQILYIKSIPGNANGV